MDRLTSKDEMTSRINMLFSDLNSKLSDRPTIEYFKKCLEAFDSKIDAV